jgi:copper(I)-binding protein
VIHKRDFGVTLKIRIFLTVALATALVIPVTGTALAHGEPKPGTACSMSGMAKTIHSKTYVCQMKDGKRTWTKGLPVSTSRLTAQDTWAKAASTGMTAVFGTINNPTNRAIRVIAATTPFSPTQIHQVAMVDGAMKMMEKPGGLVIPARGKVELKPGGDHLMLMKLSRPIKAGTRVPVTLITSNGGTTAFTAIGKPFAGANESYDENHGGHSGMSMP